MTLYLSWFRHRLAVAVLMPSLLPSGAVAGRVVGRVLDEGGQPLRAATVIVEAQAAPLGAIRYSSTTKADGSFSVDDVPFGEYSMEASAPGFVSVRFRPLNIRYLEFRWEFRLPLGPAPEGGVYSMAELIGTIRTAVSPVPFALICLSGAAGGQKCTTANRLGEYHLRVEPGEYEAVVARGDVALWRAKIVLPATGEYRDILRAE